MTVAVPGQRGNHRIWLRISSAVHDSLHRNSPSIVSPIDMRGGTRRRPGESRPAVKSAKCLGIRKSLVRRVARPRREWGPGRLSPTRKQPRKYQIKRTVLLALSVRLQGRSTPPAHRSWKSELLLCLIFFLALPLLNPWVHGDGVDRAPLNSDGTET